MVILRYYVIYHTLNQWFRTVLYWPSGSDRDFFCPRLNVNILPFDTTNLACNKLRNISKLPIYDLEHLTITIIISNDWLSSRFFFIIYFFFFRNSTSLHFFSFKIRIRIFCVSFLINDTWSFLTHSIFDWFVSNNCNLLTFSSYSHSKSSYRRKRLTSMRFNSIMIKFNLKQMRVFLL